MRLNNTPVLETERLILRKFTENDIEAILEIYKDPEVNTFLPWFPIETMEEAKTLYEEAYAREYRKPRGYRYAVCLKNDNDVRNTHSGDLMRRLGMNYQYTYEEQWQPKDVPVTFRMYQLNFDNESIRRFDRYWILSEVHYVEDESELFADVRND